MTLILALVFLTHKVDDGFMIKYPQRCIVADRVASEYIPGSTTNVFIKLDARGCLAMAGTSDAFWQRLAFGELWHSRDVPVTTNYWSFVPEDDSGDIEWFRRNMSYSYRIASPYTYPVVALGSFKSPIRNGNMDGDGGNALFIRWSSRAFEDDGKFTMPEFDGENHEKVIDLFGGRRAFANMLFNFGDLSDDRNSEWTNESYGSPDLVRLLDGFCDVTTPMQRDGSGFIRAPGVINNYLATTNDAAGKDEMSLMTMLLSAPSRPTNAYMTVAQELYPGCPISTGRLTNAALAPRFDRVSLRAFAMSNQLLGLMDMTIANGAFGPVPHVRHVEEESAGNIEIESDDFTDGIVLSWDGESGRYRAQTYPLRMEDFVTTYHGQDTSATSNWLKHVSAKITSSTRSEGWWEVVTPPGSLRIDRNFATLGPGHYDVIRLEAAFTAVFYRQEDGLICYSEQGAVSSSDEIESAYCAKSLRADVKTQYPEAVEEFDRSGRNDRSEWQEYPSPAAWAAGIVDHEKIMMLIGRQELLYGAYDDAYETQRTKQGWDPCNSFKYTFGGDRADVYSEEDVHTYAMNQVSHEIESAKSCTMSNAGTDSLKASRFTARGYLRDVIEDSLPSSCSADFGPEGVMTFTQDGWDVLYVDGEGRWHWQKDGRDVSLPTDGDRVGIGHYTIGGHFYDDTDLPIVPTGTQIDVSFPRVTAWDFSAMKRKDEE